MPAFVERHRRSRPDSALLQICGRRKGLPDALFEPGTDMILDKTCHPEAFRKWGNEENTGPRAKNEKSNNRSLVGSALSLGRLWGSSSSRYGAFNGGLAGFLVRHGDSVAKHTHCVGEGDLHITDRPRGGRTANSVR